MLTAGSIRYNMLIKGRILRLPERIEGATLQAVLILDMVWIPHEKVFCDSY